MNITTENINTLAQLAASISDGDYIYIYKAESNSFARIEKSLLLGSGGGSTSAATIANVNLLQAKIDELIGLLANSAFSSSRPEAIGELDWGSGGDVVYYYISGISSSSAMYSVSNTATRVVAGSTYTNVITAKSGYDLNSVTVNGVTQSVSNNTCTISISNVQANITISVSARVHVDPSASYSVTPSLADLQLTPNGGTVVQGGTFNGTLSLADGVSGKRLPDNITVDGTYGELTYTQSSGAIEITNIQSNITIDAAAVSESTGPMCDVTYNLTGCVKSSGPDSVGEGDGLTVVLAKDTSNWATLFGEDTNWANTFDFLARDIIVTMNGMPLERGVDFSAIKSGNNVTITIQSITGDVEITNVLWLRPGIKYTDGEQTTGLTSARTDTYITIPQSCTNIAIYGPNTNTQLSLGCALYNVDKSYNDGAALFSNEVTMQKGSGVRYVRTSAKLNTQNPTSESSIAVINNCYIYDITNGKFIWKGDNVTGRQN